MPGTAADVSFPAGGDGAVRDGRLRGTAVDAGQAREAAQKLPKSDMRDMPALNQPAEAQTVMLVEAAMLGYSPARKGGRARE